MSLTHTESAPLENSGPKEKSTTSLSTGSSLNKVFLAHVALEFIILGGLTFYFNRKVSNLNQQNDFLKKELSSLSSKVEKLEEKVNSINLIGDSIMTPQKYQNVLKMQQEFIEYRNFSTHHIKSIYGIIQEYKNSFDNNSQNLHSENDLPNNFGQEKKEYEDEDSEESLERDLDRELKEEMETIKKEKSFLQTIPEKTKIQFVSKSSSAVSEEDENISSIVDEQTTIIKEKKKKASKK